MTPKEILQKIIDHNGSCCWIDRDSYNACEICPLSNEQGCMAYVSYKYNGTRDDNYFQAACDLIESIIVTNMILGNNDDT